MNTHSTTNEIFCGREPFWREVRFWFKQVRTTNDSVSVAYGQRLTLVQRTSEQEGCEAEPTFTLSDEGSQKLMDELWRVGFRPSEGTGSAGALAAVEKHLNDMRHLVFKTNPLK